MTAIPIEQMIPCPGQGALALQCRLGDPATRAILATLNDPVTALCVESERRVVFSLKGDCASPLGALAQVRADAIHLCAMVAAAGGTLPVILAAAEAPVEKSSEALDALIQSLVNKGANQLLHSTASRGTVYLVGAGPGDPGLITVRGAELLGRADVVVYDALANPQLLKHCTQAKPIYVGKRAAAHSMTQEQINAVLVEEGKKARQPRGSA